jgi:Spermine/spermidine synthase domain
MVPEVSKLHFPQLALGFKDPRLNLQITDGIKWVQEAEEGTYDAIIVDSSDPVGPAEVLFQEVGPEARTSGIGSHVCRVQVSPPEGFRVKGPSVASRFAKQRRVCRAQMSHRVSPNSAECVGPKCRIMFRQTAPSVS